MSQSFTENDGLGLDTRVLSDFLIQLNISRRHFAAYPRNHPILTRSAAKALEQLSDLLPPGEELTVGVARDALLVGDTSLDKGNTVYRDLATALFDSGIAVVTFVVAERPKISGWYISSTLAGGTTNTPGVVARTT